MKQKILAIRKVYDSTVKVLDKGSEVTTKGIAKLAKCSLETARINLLKLVKMGQLKRDKKTKEIIAYK